MNRFLIVLAFFLASFDVDATSISVPMQINGTTCSNFTPAVSGNGVIYNCSSGPPPPGAPTNCVATVNGGASASFTSTGGTASLSVTCDPLAGITYNWSKNGAPNANINRQWSEVLPANGTPFPIVTSYRLTACNGTACVTVPASSLTATVATSGFSGTCPGFANTFVVVMPWTNPPRVIQPMGPNDVIVAQFTTGTQTTFSNLPKIFAVEYGSPPSSRIATLSPTPCDFSTQPAFSANIGPSNSVSVYFAIGTTQGVYLDYYLQAATNKTYYLNIKNDTNPTCAGSGVCQMSIDLLKGNLQ